MRATIFVTDDEPAIRSAVVKRLSRRQHLVTGFDSGDALITALDHDIPDLILLDLKMPGLSGLEVAAQLESDTAPLLVFVTAFDEHAIRAFDLNAVDYLLKPYDRDRLEKSLGRLRARHGMPRVPAAVRTARAQTGSSERLLVPRGEQLELIDAAAIHWLEADDNYVHVHTATTKYLVRRTLGDLLEQLGERFVRIHKSAAVNLAEVVTLSPLFKGDHEVHLRGGATLRLSRRFKDALFARMPR